MLRRLLFLTALPVIAQCQQTAIKPTTTIRLFDGKTLDNFDLAIRFAPANKPGPDWTLLAAETLMPTVSDCRVSQVVNVKKGIHCLSPKSTGDKEDLERPTAETSSYYVSHARDADLNKAMDQASMGMIKFLETEKKIARLDAYGLASVAMDCRVGAISDTEKNVHCIMPKSIWVASAGKR